MASTISYEYLNSIKDQANGLATLDGTSKIETTYLPDSVVNNFKGEFATSGDLPSSDNELGDYAYVTTGTSYWYWNAELATPAWVNQQITATAYDALSAAEKAAVPYIIING